MKRGGIEISFTTTLILAVLTILAYLVIYNGVVKGGSSLGEEAEKLKSTVSIASKYIDLQANPQLISFTPNRPFDLLTIGKTELVYGWQRVFSILSDEVEKTQVFFVPIAIGQQVGILDGKISFPYCVQEIYKLNVQLQGQDSDSFKQAFLNNLKAELEKGSISFTCYSLINQEPVASFVARFYMLTTIAGNSLVDCYIRNTNEYYCLTPLPIDVCKSLNGVIAPLHFCADYVEFMPIDIEKEGSNYVANKFDKQFVPVPNPGGSISNPSTLAKELVTNLVTPPKIEAGGESIEKLLKNSVSVMLANVWKTRIGEFLINNFINLGFENTVKILLKCEEGKCSVQATCASLPDLSAITLSVEGSTINVAEKLNNDIREFEGKIVNIINRLRSVGITVPKNLMSKIEGALKSKMENIGKLVRDYLLLYSQDTNCVAQAVEDYLQNKISYEKTIYEIEESFNNVQTNVVYLYNWLSQLNTDQCIYSAYQKILQEVKTSKDLQAYKKLSQASIIDDILSAFSNSLKSDVSDYLSSQFKDFFALLQSPFNSQNEFVAQLLSNIIEGTENKKIYVNLEKDDVQADLTLTKSVNGVILELQLKYKPDNAAWPLLVKYPECSPT